MAAPDLVLKRHDTWPPLQATLSDQNGPIDLTNASTVHVIMKGTTALIDGACTIDANQTSTGMGQVTYTWAIGDTAITDTYQVEFEIVWAAGGIETIPNDSYRSIQIINDLGVS